MPIFAALDIGSSFIRCFIASSKSQNSHINIIGHASLPSLGIARGTIINFSQAHNTIKNTINNATNNALASHKLDNLHIDNLIVSVSGNLAIQHLQAFVHISSGKISKKDAEQVKKQAFKSFHNDPNSQQQYHVSTASLSYYTDNNHTLTHNHPPLDLAASTLSCSAHIITTTFNNYSNIEDCTPKIHIITVPTPQAAARACLSLPMQQHGCVLVDIGAQCTSFWIVHQGSFLHAGVIPIGSHDITLAISQYFSLSLQTAEQLKISHGHASSNAEHDTTSLSIHNLLDEHDSITKGKLIDVISTQLDNITLALFKELERENIIEKTQCFFLTGKSTRLHGIAERMQIQLSKLVQDYNQQHSIHNTIDSFAQQHLSSEPHIIVKIATPYDTSSPPPSQNPYPNNPYPNNPYLRILDICPNAKEHKLFEPENHVITGLLLTGYSKLREHSPSPLLSHHHHHHHHSLSPLARLLLYAKKYI